jgi:hypothetical protein
MGMPIPSADPAALARMQKQQMYQKQHHQMVLVKFPMGMIKSSPDVELAARTGQPNLNPPDDLVSATDVLSQGAAGPAFTLGVSRVSTGGGAGSNAGGGAPAVDTESVGTSDSVPPTATGGSSVTTPDSSSVAPAADPAPTPTTANGTDSSSSAKPAASPNDSRTESTSKKKKGLHKLIPF